jgi:GT2 family glycosyltransferase
LNKSANIVNRFFSKVSRGIEVYKNEGTIIFYRKLIQFFLRKIKASFIKTATFPVDFYPNPIIPYSLTLEEQYKIFRKKFNPAIDYQALAEQLNKLKELPLISILTVVDNPETEFLNFFIDSLLNQVYENWELCVYDSCDNLKTKEILDKWSKKDSRIKLNSAAKSSDAESLNQLLKMAGGDYISLVGNTDLLEPDALFEFIKEINLSGAELIYSDEDITDPLSKQVIPHFKPDYSPDMLLSNNYVGHLTMIKRTLIPEAGEVQGDCQEGIEYDLILKVVEKTNKISHIARVLYHWNRPLNLPEKDLIIKEAEKKVLQSAIERRQIEGVAQNTDLKGVYRVKRKIRGEPLISIIIPFRDKPELLKKCFDSILEKSTYNNFEIIGISNNTKESETFELMKNYQNIDKRISFREYNFPFNYSAINNYAVNEYARGEHLILLNNDIEIISPEWIEAMLEHSQRPEIGAVGAKLYYSDDTIQHAGVIIGLLTVAGVSHRFQKRWDPGYFCRAGMIQNLSAVTAACLMISKKLYDEINGLNEEQLTVSFNDVDFCLKLQEKGYLNIFTPYCEAYHFESASRGYDNSGDYKIKRAAAEGNYIKSRYNLILLRGDPFYNPNLTLNREDFSLDI